MPVKQFYPQQRFQVCNNVGNGWLGHADHLSSLFHAAQVCHLHENLQVFEPGAAQEAIQQQGRSGRQGIQILNRSCKESISHSGLDAQNGTAYYRLADLFLPDVDATCLDAGFPLGRF